MAGASSSPRGCFNRTGVGRVDDTTCRRARETTAADVGQGGGYKEYCRPRRSGCSGTWNRDGVRPRLAWPAGAATMHTKAAAGSAILHRGNRPSWAHRPSFGGAQTFMGPPILNRAQTLVWGHRL
eukprot:360766-Chlamydomonas_euryale.AAC.13